jgi:hypothetical protein
MEFFGLVFLSQQDAALVAGQRDSFEVQLRNSEAEAQQAQKDSELAVSQRDALQAQLETVAQKAKLERQDNDQVLDRPQAQQSLRNPIVRPKLETNRSRAEAHLAKLRPKEPPLSVARPKAALTESEAFRRFDAKFDGKERAIGRQILSTDQKIGSASGKTKEDLKAWKKYLERQRQYIRKLRRYEEVALLRKLNESQEVR